MPPETTTEAAVSSSEDAVLPTVGDLFINTGENVPTTVTVESGVVTLAMQTPAGEVSISLSASDAERLDESLETKAAELDEEATDRGTEWLHRYRDE